MKTSDTIAALAPALTSAIGNLEGAAKNAKNTHFKNTYADLGAVVEASRKVLAEHDLAAIQAPGTTQDGKLQVFTRIIHKSGEWIESEFFIPIVKPDPQMTLAALTYARRGALMAMLGMPAVDDDGETAVGRGEAKAAKAAPSNNLSVTPEGKDWWGCEGSGPTANKAKQEGLGERADELRHEITSLTSGAEWRKWCKDHSEEIGTLPISWRIELRNTAELMASDLGVDLNARDAS